LVAACLLIAKGLDAQTAIERVRAGRGVPIPETPEQRRWIDYYTGSLAGNRWAINLRWSRFMTR